MDQKTKSFAYTDHYGDTNSYWFEVIEEDCERIVKYQNDSQTFRLKFKQKKYKIGFI